MSPGTRVTEPAPRQPVVFEHIAIEAFRGFNARVEFDLDASIVIVHGPNGTGKTSLFDAMQWLLLGELPRVASARLRTTEEHIVNMYRPGDSAKVAARVRLGDKVVSLTRVGNRNSSTLAWSEVGSAPLFGDDAESALEASFSASEQMDLRTSLTACGLLQQDAARLVLQAKPRERFAIFSQLLGLSDLEKFEDWTQARARAASRLLAEASQSMLGAERGAAQARDQLNRALELAAQRPAVETVLQRLSEVVRSLTVLRLTTPATRDDAIATTAGARRHAAELSELAAMLESIDAAEAAAAADRELEESLSRVEAEVETNAELLASRRSALAPARSTLSAARSTQEGLARMAAAVLPHLAGSDCPVCGNAIAVNEVRGHLEELVGDDGAVASLVAAVADLESEVRALETKIAAAQTSAGEIRTQLQKARSREQEVQMFRERLEILQTSEVIGLEAEPESNRDLLAWLRLGRSEATRLTGVAQEFIAALDASGGAEEIRATQALSSAEAHARNLELSKQQAEAADRNASVLHEAASAARLDVVRSEFARLSPVAQDVFSRLDPHPTFTELELETDVLRSASTATARVRDVQQDVAADPMVIFSSAQANIAAISYLVALNWTTASRVPVLLLDDPLQAMDDINVLGFADLCRHLRLQRQVIVSTHERRFAQLLERKLTPRDDRDRTVVHEFVGWERSGPLTKERSMGAGGA